MWLGACRASRGWWVILGAIGLALGGFTGPLDRPKKVSKLMLEVYWASFARFVVAKDGFVALGLGAKSGLRGWRELTARCSSIRNHRLCCRLPFSPHKYYTYAAILTSSIVVVY